MRQTTGDFAPGRAALGGGNPRHIVKDHDIAPATGLGQTRTAQQQHLRHPVRALQLKLRLPFKLFRRGEMLANKLAEHLLPRPLVSRFANQSIEIVIERRQRPFIHRAQHKTAIEHQHPGREVGQDGFEITASRLHLGAVALGFTTGIVELTGHLVERLGQHAEFVTAINGLTG